MDDQQNKPTDNIVSPKEQLVVPPAQAAASPPSVAPQVQPGIPQNTASSQAPTKQISDSEAQSLLAINSLDTKRASKSSKKFLLLTIGSIIILVVLTLFIESRNHSSTSSSTGSSTTSSKNPFTSGNGSVDSEVKYCSNPINAQLTC